MSAATTLFYGVCAAIALGIPLYAYRARGRTYGIFSGVLVAFCLPGVLALHTRLLAVWPGIETGLSVAFAVAIASTGVQLAHLVRAKLTGPLFRWGVSVPGQTFLAAGFFSGIWLLPLWILRLGLDALGAGGLLASPWLDLAPLGLCIASIGTSLRLVPEVVRIRLGVDGPHEIARVPVERHRGRPPRATAERALRIVQIADPHLGPWQSVTQLQRTIGRLLERGPDLVVLTGDFLTMEGRGSPGALARSLEPLADWPGTRLAIFGNHDHEAPDEVRSALEENGVDLLVDDERLLETPIGPVQVVGADYRGREKKEHLEALLARFPRRHDHMRLLLLHDPLGFQHVPLGDADLTLSGHTHGGQVGLVSLGVDWTVLARSRWPDHGLFARGRSRLYVHRGTGFYGFPLRVGVPGEASVLEVVPA